MSRVIKRSIVISGHATSISLEEEFWRQLKRLAEEDGISLAELVARVDAARKPGEGGLSGTLRVFALTRALNRSLP